MFKSCAEEHLSLKSVNVEAVHISATWRATIKVPLGAACSANLLLQSWCAQHMMCKSISPGCSLLFVCNCASLLCTYIASSVMQDMGWTLEWFTSEQSTTFRKVRRRGLWYLTCSLWARVFEFSETAWVCMCGKWCLFLYLSRNCLVVFYFWGKSICVLSSCHHVCFMFPVLVQESLAGTQLAEPCVSTDLASFTCDLVLHSAVILFESS